MIKRIETEGIPQKKDISTYSREFEFLCMHVRNKFHYVIIIIIIMTYIFEYVWDSYFCTAHLLSKLWTFSHFNIAFGNNVSYLRSSKFTCIDMAFCSSSFFHPIFPIESEVYLEEKVFEHSWYHLVKLVRM